MSNAQNLIDITNLRDAELDLLLGLKADPEGEHDLENVRASALPLIVDAAGLEWNDNWRKIAARAALSASCEECQGPDYEGAILAQQGY